MTNASSIASKVFPRAVKVGIYRWPVRIGVDNLLPSSTGGNTSIVSHWPTDITTDSGPVRGHRDRFDTFAWLGLPYGAPPVGDLRWKAPRPPAPWSEPLIADRYAPAPWQYGVEGSSEDCLYLNVLRPDTDADSLPVYVWLPGGGNRVQMPPLSETPGDWLAAHSEVVVVTVSYRLGDLGWFAHPALREGNDPLDDSGNYGTTDMIAALRWIRDNIANFGGDPGNVTVTGESAGAYNTLTLMASPAATGLFHKAIAHSGRHDTASIRRADERGAAVLAALAERAGVPVPDSVPEIRAFLRSASPTELSAASRRLPFFAGFRDGTVFHSEGFAVFASADLPNRVPTIIGMNREESKFSLASNRELTSDRDRYERVAGYGSDLKRATGCDNLLRDLVAGAEAAGIEEPLHYGYLFSWGWDGGDHPSPIAGSLGWRLGAAHGMDIPFFLNGATKAVMGGDRIFDDANEPGRRDLATKIAGYVANFVRTGNPQPLTDSVPTWQPWSNDDGGPKLIVFDADHQEAHIHMDHDEYTVASVEDRYSDLDEAGRAFGVWAPL